ncbi:unnamed protein product [Somion occarium]|uniref:T6SS Phospholipase effector Tle1-like catalytic domain-containing protein n=1 Tax=Somion occarium TaxID=3059160 RepID=A0ABP1DMI4_9APHY
MTKLNQPHITLAENDVIPPTNVLRPRTLVLCFDGTGDQFDNDNSNVVQLFSLLQKDDHRQQMVYYQAGIGTYTVPQIATPIMSKVSKAMDEAVAWNLDAHVMDGYSFLMENYQGGDKICLFGFSRGAYTARSLAGMIQKVGLLPAGNHQQVPFAYKMYTRASEQGWKQSAAFKKAFSIDVDVEFVGVWDTVCSVGLISRRLPFVSSNSAIRFFRHAVSLDERRAKFKANLYNRPTEAESKLGVQPGQMPKSGVTPSSSKLGMPEAVQDWIHKTTNSAQLEEQRQAEREIEFTKQDHNALDTDVKEVWFAGCHCDVGGGSVPNDTRHNLARIPLRWMIRQCFLTNTGIRFHSSLLKKVGLDSASLYPIVQPRPPALYFTPTHNRTPTDATLVGTEDSDKHLTEEEEDLKDALSPVYDQLLLKPFWWILELLPLSQRYQRKDNTWIEKINRGRGRVVPKFTEKDFYVHRSVKIRMDGKGLKGGSYSPKARFSTEPTWVD